MTKAGRDFWRRSATAPTLVITGCAALATALLPIGAMADDQGTGAVAGLIVFAAACFVSAWQEWRTADEIRTPGIGTPLVVGSLCLLLVGLELDSWRAGHPLFAGRQLIVGGATIVVPWMVLIAHRWWRGA